MLHQILRNSTEGNMINLTRKFSILSLKILHHRTEFRQDRYLSICKLLNRAARARDLTRSKTLWSLLYDVISDVIRYVSMQVTLSVKVQRM